MATAHCVVLVAKYIELNKANVSIIFAERPLCAFSNKKKNTSFIGQTVTIDVECAEYSLATDVSTGIRATDEARTRTGTQAEIS